jgi:hypothetical protein
MRPCPALCIVPLQATQAFDVSLLRVEQLELRVQARDKNQHCHAVWVDPSLTVCCHVSLWLWGAGLMHAREVGCGTTPLPP